ncbi:MAG TPA: hypothetical protein VD966_02990, partial [Pyrinomonadaceae bacterium]|nr:hypothetical protein [Pyrinomonadaceae bacterium]
IHEMERAIADWTEAENAVPYVRGDVFCLEDHVLYLIFGEAGGEQATALRAGIVYGARTAEPFRKLEVFCREVRESLLALRGEAEASAEGGVLDLTEWRQGKPVVPAGFTRFFAKQDIDSLYTSLRKETVAERIHAAELLEDPSTRLFLRRAKEAHDEGYAAKLLSGERIEASEFSIDKLSDVGLVQREVLVSCRKTGHALFRLPSPDALAVVTVSNAMCSECGAPVADERVEEAVAPTRLASALLEDGSWLVNRLYTILRQLGIPDSEIAIGPSTGEGEAHMMANVCGESFLFVLRDGDLTPAFARRAIDMEVETESTHLVIVTTGRIHNEGRVRLLDHARRRMRVGNDIELIIVEGAGAVAAELQQAFERVSQRVLAEQLCEMDASLGLSVSRLIITRFQLQQQPGKQLARPSVDAPLTSSREMKPPAPLVARASSGAGDRGNHSQLVSPDFHHQDL